MPAKHQIEALLLKSELHAGKSLSDRIRDDARPGENFIQVAERLRKEDKLVAATKSSLRKPPARDEQPNFFVPKLFDVGTKDSRSIMDVAVFRLSKRHKRVGESIRYDLSDGHVTVSAGSAGMATIWDYDLVMMAISHLTEATNRWKKGDGDKPGRVFHPYLSDILKFCRRSQGGRQKDQLVDVLLRLNTTHIAVERTQKGKNGRTIRVSEGEPLISRYKVVTDAATGKPESAEIGLPQWLYDEVVSARNPDVLTVHPDFFLVELGIGRFVYRLARRAAGRGQASWGFEKIFLNSGSAGTLKKFTFTLRKLISANDLPEYQLAEESGQKGPLLTMTYRPAALGSGS